MSTTPMSARRSLIQEIAAALGSGATAEEVVDLVIRDGWQPRPVPHPDSDHVEGLLADGRIVPIEIRRARVRQTV